MSEYRPRQHQPLLLAPGQPDPTFTDQGVVPIWQFSYEVIRAGQICSLCYLRIIGFRASVQNIESDSLVEHIGVLTDDSQSRPPRLGLKLREWQSTNCYPALLGLAEAL